MNQEKKYWCYFPGCNTYGTREHFLEMPLDSSDRARWLELMPKTDQEYANSNAVCKKHFKDVYGIKQSLKPKENIEPVVIPKENIHPVVITKENIQPVVIPKENIQPVVIPKSVNANIDVKNKCLPKKTYLFYRMSNVKVPQTFSSIGNQRNNDFLINLQNVKQLYQQRLKMFLKNGKWICLHDDKIILFYKIGLKVVPKILTSIEIDENMLVTVTLGGRIMDPLDLTWVVPVNRKILRWSQLEKLLLAFGK